MVEKGVKVDAKAKGNGDVHVEKVKEEKVKVVQDEVTAQRDLVDNVVKPVPSHTAWRAFAAAVTVVAAVFLVCVVLKGVSQGQSFSLLPSS